MNIIHCIPYNSKSGVAHPYPIISVTRPLPSPLFHGCLNITRWFWQLQQHLSCPSDFMHLSDMIIPLKPITNSPTNYLADRNSGSKFCWL